jgi:hypothetical protein
MILASTYRGCPVELVSGRSPPRTPAFVACTTVSENLLGIFKTYQFTLLLVFINIAILTKHAETQLESFPTRWAANWTSS